MPNKFCQLFFFSGIAASAIVLLHLAGFIKDVKTAVAVGAFAAIATPLSAQLFLDQEESEGKRTNGTVWKDRFLDTVHTQVASVPPGTPAPLLTQMYCSAKDLLEAVNQIEHLAAVAEVQVPIAPQAQNLLLEGTTNVSNSDDNARIEDSTEAERVAEIPEEGDSSLHIVPFSRNGGDRRKRSASGNDQQQQHDDTPYIGFM